MKDVVVFAALAWEAQVVLDALQGVEASRSRQWRGYLGDGASVSVVQMGVGPERARIAAERAPMARLFLSTGCAGALAGGLHAGQIVLGDRVLVLNQAGRSAGELALAPDAVAAWAAARGIAVRRGTVASSPVVLAKQNAKERAGRAGALVVEMESAGIVTAAKARGIGAAVVKVVLDEADDDMVLPGGDVIDRTTGEFDVSRALFTLAPRPQYWPVVLRLARQQRVAERRLRAFLAVLFSAGLEALGLAAPAMTTMPSVQAG